MRIMLTSFGIWQDAESIESQSPFYQMPPVYMRALLNNTLMPDFAALLLYDNVLMDTVSYSNLQEHSSSQYSMVAQTIATLHSEGFVELVDFNAILRNNEQLLMMMLKQDLSIVQQWLAPLRTSLDIWNDFTLRMIDASLEYEDAAFDVDRIAYHAHMARNMVAQHLVALGLYGPIRRIRPTLKRMLSGDRKRFKAEEITELRQILSQYLSYVNANIILSNELEICFHDWADFAPFYKQKFLSVGRTDLAYEQDVTACHKLFEVAFPEFTITNVGTLMKILTDKRVESLRLLVREAVEGRVKFDEDFARRTFMEVISGERKAGRFRSIVSYVTLPLNLLDFLSPVPGAGTFAQMVTDKLVGSLGERKVKEKYQWFYLLSDVAKGA